jgi:hypothetical protein
LFIAFVIKRFIMELFDCPTCGRGGWTTYEIEDGLCPCCQQEEFETEEEWEEEEWEEEEKYQNDGS